MTEPKRIQRKRTKGWRLPPNTASVTRPGDFGNPFTLEHGKGAEWAVKEFSAWLADRSTDRWPSLVQRRERLLSRLHELTGKDLACFCDENSEWCHGDVLLRLANTPEMLDAKKQNKAGGEADVCVVVIKPDEKTDYEQFSTYARQQGCCLTGVVGQLPDNAYVRVESWVVPDRGGEAGSRFLLLVGKEGKIGVFDLVGAPYAPLVKDIQWLHEKVLAVQQR